MNPCNQSKAIEFLEESVGKMHKVIFEGNGTPSLVGQMATLISKTENTQEAINDLSENIKEQNEKLEVMIKDKMSPIYWVVGIFITIASGVIGFQTNQILNEKEYNEKAYLQKLDYYQSQRTKNSYILEAISTPKNGVLILSRSDDEIAQALGFKLTTRGGKE